MGVRGRRAIKAVDSKGRCGIHCSPEELSTAFLQDRQPAGTVDPFPRFLGDWLIEKKVMTEGEKQDSCVWSPALPTPVYSWAGDVLGLAWTV